MPQSLPPSLAMRKFSPTPVISIQHEESAASGELFRRAASEFKVRGERGREAEEVLKGRMQGKRTSSFKFQHKIKD